MAKFNGSVTAVLLERPKPILGLNNTYTVTYELRANGNTPVTETRTIHLDEGLYFRDPEIVFLRKSKGGHVSIKTDDKGNLVAIRPESLWYALVYENVPIPVEDVTRRQNTYSPN